MNYIELTITTAHTGVDMLVCELEDMGIRGFAIEDSVDFQEFLDDVTPHWDYVDEDLMKLKNAPTTVKIYPADNEQGRETVEKIRKLCNKLKTNDSDGIMGPMKITIGGVREEDWENNYKKYYHTFPVGKKLLIKPSWENIEDDGGRRVLEIDPSSSFGTGSHETTRLCLGTLEEYIRPGDKVLDMGCGSGILSMAAMLLDAGSVLCVDIDQSAVKTARENLKRNGFTENVSVLQGNALEDADVKAKVEGERYDLITANIVADVIIGMRDLFWRCLMPGGTLLTSGIIGPRADEVRQALENSGFDVLERREDNDWILFACKKKNVK